MLLGRIEPDDRRRGPRGRHRAVRRALTGGICTLAIGCLPLAAAAGPAGGQAGNGDGGDSANAVAAGQQQEAEPGLTAAQAFVLQKAAGRGEEVTVESIVIAAIAKSPDRASRIIEDAVATTPKYAQMIVKAVEKTFPDLGDRIEAAAKRALKKTAEQQAPAPALPPHGDKAAKTAAKKAAEKAAEKTEAAAEQARRISAAKSEQSTWSGEVSLGGSYRTGSTRSVGTNFGAKVKQTIGKWENSLRTSFDYNKSDGDTDTQKLQIRGKSKRSLTKRLYGFGLLGYKDDRFSGLAYELNEAAGVGYRVVDAESFTWDLELGPAFRQSRVTETGEFAKEVFVRGGSEIAWTISDTAKFTNETSLLYSGDKVELDTATSGLFQNSNDLTNVSALDMTIIGNLAARLSSEFSYTNEPPPGGTHTETLSKIALVQSF